jgi:SAM-dependent methyltransferase
MNHRLGRDVRPSLSMITAEFLIPLLARDRAPMVAFPETESNRNEVSLPTLPARYQEPWEAPFQQRLTNLLRPGQTILDVGAGRKPTLSPDRRPKDCTYVGLDISADELAAAPVGSYDETWVADVTERVSGLEGRFDIVVSWQVLEHVRPLEAAFDNFYAYLRPGGHFVGQFSGMYSYFGLANRLIPHRLTAWLVDRFTERSSNSVFPAHYHRCRESALRSILAPWARADIVPRFTGAPYLRSFPPAQWVYLLYEDWAMRSAHPDLATHYIVEAER